MVPEQAGEQGGREGVAPGGRIYATPRRVESTPTRPVRARCTREDLGSRASDRAATTARGWQVVLNPPRSGAQQRVPAARHEDVAPGARPVAVAPLNDAETERAAAPAFAAAATRGGGGLVGPLDGAPVRRAVGAARRSRRHRPGPPPLSGRRGLDRPPWSGTSCPRRRLGGDSAGLTATMARVDAKKVAVLLGTTQEHRRSTSWRSPPARRTSQLRQPRWRTSGRSAS